MSSAPNQQRDAVYVILEPRSFAETRNVAWACASPASPVVALQAVSRFRAWEDYKNGHGRGGYQGSSVVENNIKVDETDSSGKFCLGASDNMVSSRGSL